VPGPGRTHRVGNGQTLSHIARDYGVTVAELERANPGLDPRRIRVGQTIRIPGGSAAAPAAPAAAETPVAQPAAEPATTAQTHTVRSGDTLDAISRRYGTTVAALQRANPGLNARRLMPGQTIRLP
jgi:LysM repeat protein